MLRRGAWLLIAGLALVGGQAVRVAAQEAYPNRTVRWVVPFPAGGPTDTLSRILVARLAEMWGQSVVVENKGGASGAIGTDFTAKSPPDGYTLMLGTQSTNASNMIFFPNLPYDPIKDFQPLTLIGTACMALVTAPSVPANTPKEFVEWVKTQAGGVSYASAAPGSSQHVAAELMVKARRHAGDARALSRQFGGHARPDERARRLHVR
jgi:tripartite-type tricarboxylate transporter receptor subunit TctC